MYIGIDEVISNEHTLNTLPQTDTGLAAGVQSIQEKVVPELQGIRAAIQQIKKRSGILQ